MSNPTYSVDAAKIQAYLPQWEAEGVGDPHTTQRLTDLINQQAGLFNSLIKSKGIDPDAVASDTADSPYFTAQAVVTGCCLQYILAGLEFGDVSDAGEKLAEQAKNWLERFEKDPTILGMSDTTTYPRAYTTVQSLGLGTSDVDKKHRRKWSQFGGAPGDRITKKVQW